MQFQATLLVALGTAGLFGVINPRWGWVYLATWSILEYLMHGAVL